MRKQKGFSLIELLIVVAIILIIAAIAIPNLLRSRIAANEASAVGSLRTINTAQRLPTLRPIRHRALPLSLAILGGTGTSVQLRRPLCCWTTFWAPPLRGGTGSGSSANVKSGYQFCVTASGTQPVPTYSSNANPVTVEQTGKRYFYSDASGVIRYNTTAPGHLDRQFLARSSRKQVSTRRRFPGGFKPDATRRH